MNTHRRRAGKGVSPIEGEMEVHSQNETFGAAKDRSNLAFFVLIGSIVWKLKYLLLLIFGIAMCFKVLMIPAYHSTDFEVHRNWLAITSSLPISKWYYDTTSEWTLDYPPYFAFLEWILSFPARWIDPKMCDISSAYYDAWSVIAFQRVSVMVLDLFLVLGVISFFGLHFNPLQRSRLLDSLTIFFLIIMSPALFMVDHIHFQYNGFLIGLFLISFSLILKGKSTAGLVLFDVLLHFKHIFLYFAPIYGLYALRATVQLRFFDSCGRFSISLRWKQLLVLIASALIVDVVAYSAFIIGFDSSSWFPISFDWGQMHQIMSRLFPVGRGLIHAYWAPNFWALYTLCDKLLLRFVKRGILPLSMCPQGALNLRGAEIAVGTAGLVGEMNPHICLPAITPSISIICVLIAISPVCIWIWKYPKRQLFAYGSLWCGMSFFMFGWHVHEKAILMILIPSALLATQDALSMKLFLFLAPLASFAQFPLLHRPQETVVKCLMHLCYMSAAHLACDAVRRQRGMRRPLFDLFQSVFMWSALPIVIFVESLSPIMFPQLPFLPQMMISVYVAVGCLWWMALLFVKMLRLKNRKWWEITSRSAAEKKT